MATRTRKKTGSSKKKFIRKKQCFLCEQKTDGFDYKDVDLLKRYLSEKGKILPRKMTGFCAKHQRMLSAVIKRARHSGLMAFSAAV